MKYAVKLNGQWELLNNKEDAETFSINFGMKFYYQADIFADYQTVKSPHFRQAVNKCLADGWEKNDSVKYLVVSGNKQKYQKGSYNLCDFLDKQALLNDDIECLVFTLKKVYTRELVLA